MKFPHKVLQLVECTDGHLVVYVWDNLDRKDTTPRIWENVEFFDFEGRKIWTINGMENFRYWRNSDFFVGTRWFEGRLQVTSFSGNSFDLNLATGEVRHFEFHK